MEKYIRVDWPESQEWMFQRYYDDGVEFSQSCGTTVFVPEELYNEVKGIVPTKRKNLFLKPVNNE